jgi:hypothetical protein
MAGRQERPTARPRSSSSKAPPARRRPTTARRALTTSITAAFGGLRDRWRRKRATSPATRVVRSPRRSCRRIPTPTSSTPTMMRWRWAQSPRWKRHWPRSRDADDCLVFSIDGGKEAVQARGRRQDQRRGRVQPTLRTKGLRDRRRNMRPATLSKLGDHQPGRQVSTTRPTPRPSCSNAY